MARNSARDAALARHMAAERAAFRLKPWETCPVSAGGDPPDPSDGSMRAATWRKARLLREKLLAADPHRYADLEDDSDSPDAQQEPAA